MNGATQVPLACVEITPLSAKQLQQREQQQQSSDHDDDGPELCVAFLKVLARTATSVVVVVVVVNANDQMGWDHHHPLRCCATPRKLSHDHNDPS